jgi:hypothetical protein
MMIQIRSRFLHRLNGGGSYESFCKVCRIMVGSAKDETDLARYEREHTCDPVRLYQLRENPFTGRQMA